MYRWSQPDPARQRHPRVVIDTSYCDAVKSLQASATFFAVLNALKCALSVFIIALFVSKQEPEADRFLLFVAVLGGQAIALLIINAWKLKTLADTQRMLDIARNTGHTSNQFSETSTVTIYNISQRVVTLQQLRSARFTYLLSAEESIQRQQSENLRRFHRINVENVIDKLMTSRNHLPKIIVVLHCAGLAMSILLIVMLVRYPLSKESRTFTIVLLALELLSRLISIGVIILVMALSILVVLMCILAPIVLVCVFSCCPNRFHAAVRNLIPMPRARSPNTRGTIPSAVLTYEANTQLNTDPECRICLQNFNIGERYTCLPCSQHHIFHEFCLKSWFSVSSTCPVCRRPYQAESQLMQVQQSQPLSEIIIQQ